LVIATGLFFQGWMLLVPNEGRYRKPFEGLLVCQVLLLLDLRRRTPSIASSTPPENIPDKPELAV
jgi:hypothetical protein